MALLPKAVCQKAAQVMGRIPSHAGIGGPGGAAVYRMRQDGFFPSMGFPGEVLGLKPRQQSWAAAAHLAQVEEQVRGRGVQSSRDAGAGA